MHRATPHEGIHPTPGAGGASDDGVWEEFAAWYDELAAAAASTTELEPFYRRLLDGCVESLAALGGMVWTRRPDGAFAPLVTQGPATHPDSPEQQRVEALLSRAQSTHQPSTACVGEHQVTVAPVSVAEQNRSQTVALISLTQRGGRPEAFYASAERLLTGVAEIASTVHTRHAIVELRDHAAWSNRLLSYAKKLGGDPDLGATAYRIANEGRDTLGCDRLSLVRIEGRRAKLLAVSGAESVERRGGAARRLTELAKLVAHGGTHVTWPSDSVDETLAHQLDAYCDASHARGVCLARIVAEPTDEDKQPSTPLGVLVAENYAESEQSLSSARLASLADASTPALEEALLWESVPGGALLRGLGRRLRWGLAARLAAVAIALAACVAALIFVRVEHRITLAGSLQPAQQRAVFAPADALVEQVLVDSGQQVAAGEPLLRLHSPELSLEIQRLSGELSGVLSQLQAVTAARSSANAQGLRPVEALGLSAEGKLLEHRANSLRAEIALLREERDSLLISSPIDGVVSTWKPDELLAARPVARGQRLLSIAESGADWRLELRAPDDRIGLILDACAADSAPLRVAYETLDGEGAEHWGRVVSIAAQAEMDHSQAPMVRIEVAPKAPRDPIGATQIPLPGESVRARVYCGRRSLGYVLLHDAWEMLTRWWRL